MQELFGVLPCFGKSQLSKVTFRLPGTTFDHDEEEGRVQWGPGGKLLAE